MYSSLSQYTFQAYSNPLADHQLYDTGEFGKDFSIFILRWASYIFFKVLQSFWSRHSLSAQSLHFCSGLRGKWCLNIGIYIHMNAYNTGL